MGVTTKEVCNPVVYFICIVSKANLSVRVTWRTESNALEKSKALTWTKLLVDNMSQTVWIRATIATVVGPVVLNTYWSDK